MLKGFWKLTWVETKVFVREPMGFLGTIGIPVIAVSHPWTDSRARPCGLHVGGHTAFQCRDPCGAPHRPRERAVARRHHRHLPRGRHPQAPAGDAAVAGDGSQRAGGGEAGFAVLSLALLVLAGKRVFPGVMHVNVLSFAAALLLSTLSILSLGFVIASLVPTARFAQPIGTAVLYPMVAFSGLFFPVDHFPRALRVVALVLPTTHAVALMQGIWDGSGWGAHWLNVVALIVLFAAFTALSTKVFRWE